MSSSCFNVAKYAFGNSVVNSSYASDYLYNKKSKLVNCNARKTIQCKKGFTQGKYLLYNNEQLRRNGVLLNHSNLNSGLYTQNNFEGTNNICKYGAETGGVVACTSPTTVDTGLLPFYSYYKINSYNP
jgi:hypothetical protein